jgi:hypothetical protein
MEFDVAGLILNIYYASVIYSRMKNGIQCGSALCILDFKAANDSVRRALLCSIQVEFDIPMNTVYNSPTVMSGKANSCLTRLLFRKDEVSTLPFYIAGRECKHYTTQVCMQTHLTSALFTGAFLC